MKIWVSCYQYRTWKGGIQETHFRLHALEPSWVDKTEIVGGGFWSSCMDTNICAAAVLDVLGETAPELGELLEIEVNPTTTWVMK